MAEYIEREAAIAFLRKCRVYKFQGQLPDGRICHFSDIRQGIEDMPAADVVPVRHGRCISTGYDEQFCEFGDCSICGGDMQIKSKFCPNCGARMGGEE